MANKSAGAARTAPKGRATTPQRSASGTRTLLTPTVQWIMVVIVALLIIAGILWVLRDVRTTGGGGHTGLAPAVGSMPAASTT